MHCRLYLHLTQISHLEKINRETCLSKGYHIAIGYKTCFKTMNMIGVKSACLARLRQIRILHEMNSPTIWTSDQTQSTRIRLASSKCTSNGHMWTELFSFMAPTLLYQSWRERNGHKEGGPKNKNLLLKFTTFASISKATHQETILQFFRMLAREIYYKGKQHKVMSLIQPDATKDFAFLILISKEAQDTILNNEFISHHERIQVSITGDKEAIAPLELHISIINLITNKPFT